MKSVFITGTSSGLGKALTEHYLEADWEVFGVSRRSAEDAKHYRHEVCDIASFETIEPALERLFGDVKELDLLVLNAGVLGGLEDIAAVKMEQLKATMDVNMWANKVILDYFLQRGIAVGQVIGLSSGASVSGSRGWSGYALSKAAFNMLLRLYAREMPDSHITAVAPGLIETPMLGHILYEEHDTERFTSVLRLRNSKALGEVMTPEQAARQIAEALPRLRAKESGLFVDLRYL